MITFSGIAEAQDRARRVAQAFRDRVETVLTVWARLVIEDMQQDHPFRDRTGLLTSSMGYEVVSFGNGPVAFAVLFAKAPYAEYVEFGTAHARPYPFFWPMIYKHLPRLSDELQLAVDAAMESA